jgi:hypothetical protein
MTALMPLVTARALILVSSFISIPLCLPEFYFGENQLTSKEHFPSKKKISRLMADMKKKVFWMELFKKLSTLPLAIKTFRNKEGNTVHIKVR